MAPRTSRCATACAAGYRQRMMVAKGVTGRRAVGWAKAARVLVEGTSARSAVPTRHVFDIAWARRSACRVKSPAARPVAVGTRVASRPPHRTVRAAFPHTAPTSVPDDASLPRCGVCAPAPVPHESGSKPGVCFAGTHFPWPRPFAPPAPAWITPRRSSASQLLWPRPTSCIRTSPATAPRLPDADLGALCHRSDAGSPSFRHAPSARDVLFDLGRATAPRKTVLLMLRSAAKESLRPDKKGISRLNHTPHAVAVYAS